MHYMAHSLFCSSSLCPSKSGDVCKQIRFCIPGLSQPVLPGARSSGRRVTLTLKPVAASALSGPLRFIVDSGSAFDIANSAECSRELLARVINLDPTLEMSTVNGPITVNDRLKNDVPALRKGMEFALLPNSPSIISLGRRCMLDGFEFHWP